MKARENDRRERVPVIELGRIARRGRGRRALACALLLLQLTAACAGERASAPPAQTPATTPAPASVPAAQETSLRSLAGDAPFIELVRAVRALAQQGDTHASGECLMTDTAHGYRLDAELMLALDVLPDPPADLDGQLQRDRGQLALLTGWGVLGAPDASFVLTAFTATPPQRLRAAPVALVLTDQGAYLRSGARAAADAEGPLPPEGALQRLLGEPALADGPLVVSAEASVPLISLVALLQALPEGRTAALGVALPSGTKLPAVSVPAEQLACPNGLPDVDAGRAEGEIDAHKLAEVLRSLQPETERCLSNANGAGRAGGAFTLALRIAASGSAEDACVLDGEVSEPSLVACVLQAVRAVQYPKPSPAGFVDVHVPLRLEPQPWPEQKPWCGATR